QSLDHQLFLAHQFFDYQAEAILAYGDDDDEKFLLGRRFGMPLQSLQPHQSEDFIAQFENLAIVHAVEFAFVCAADLHDRGQRHGVNLFADAEKQGLDDSQCERHLKIKSCAGADNSFNMDRTFEALEDGLDHVHAHAPAGNGGDFFGGAESRMENQVQCLLLAEA